MALKTILESLDDVPEAQRALYTEFDGKYVLELDGLESHPDARALKNALDKERETRRKATKRAEELQAEADRYKDIDPDRAREAMAKLQEIKDSELIDAGKIDELVTSRTERLRADAEAQIAAIQKARDEAAQQAETLRAQLSSEMIDNRIKDVAIQAGARASAMPDVLARARSVWRLNDEGRPVAYRDADTPIYGKDGNAPLGMDEWVESLAGEASHLFEANRGSGANGAGSDSGRTAPKTIRGDDENAIGMNLEAVARGEVEIAQ